MKDITIVVGIEINFVLNEKDQILVTQRMIAVPHKGDTFIHKEDVYEITKVT